MVVQVAAQQPDLPPGQRVAPSSVDMGVIFGVCCKRYGLGRLFQKRDWHGSNARKLSRTARLIVSHHPRDKASAQRQVFRVRMAALQRAEHNLVYNAGWGKPVEITLASLVPRPLAKTVLCSADGILIDPGIVNALSRVYDVDKEAFQGRCTRRLAMGGCIVAFAPGLISASGQASGEVRSDKASRSSHTAGGLVRLFPGVG